LEERVALYNERKKKRAPEFARALEIKAAYNAEIVIPLPEMDKSEKPAVANLLNLGLDQTALRIASTEPDPYYAPLRPGFDKWEELAEGQRKATLGWYDMNDLVLRSGRVARRFIGYSMSSTLVVPDFMRKIPKWQYMDPLLAFPAPTADPDDMCPEDCIFAYDKPLRWVKYNYPDAFNAIARRRNDTDDLDKLFTVIEYNDCDIWTLDLIGESKRPYDETIQGVEAYNLMETVNKAGQCLAVVPGRVTLDTPQGQFDGMLGMYQQQAMLQALSVIATKKGIFKDEWLIARANEVPKIIQMADGLKGKIGIIQGGDIKEMPLDPSYMTPQMIDRLERYQRVEGGIPAQFGGETTTNVRTGRMGDSILGSQIDFTVQEAQKVLAKAREEETKRAIALDKGYWGSKQKSFYVPWKGSVERFDYKPDDLWETDNVKVTYAHAGVDENGRTIEIGQLLGMELISKSEARKRHPLIQDPDLMGEEVIKEGLEQAVLTSVQQMAAQPGAHYEDVARIAELVTQQDMTIIQAVLQVQKEAQQRQAGVDENGMPMAVPSGSPPTMPGLNAPGQGAEAASVQGPSQTLQNVGNLFSRLRQPQMTVAAERGA
jgi:hypothetical protein